MSSHAPARAAARSRAFSSSPALGARPLAVIALVALIGAGCSDAPAETGGGGGENAAAESSPNPELKEKLPEFAKCMRENGVQDFPDPDGQGVIRFHGDAHTPEFESARENCRDLLPGKGGLGAGNVGPGGGG
jgi:hypothetical protein